MDNLKPHSTSVEARHDCPSAFKDSLFHGYGMPLLLRLNFILTIVPLALMAGFLSRERDATSRALTTVRAEQANLRRDVMRLREASDEYARSSNQRIADKSAEIDGLHLFVYTLLGRHDLASYTGPRRVVSVEYHTTSNGRTGPYWHLDTLLEYQRRHLLPVAYWSDTHPENPRCPYIAAGQEPNADELVFTLHIELADGTHCPTTALREPRR